MVFQCNEAYLTHSILDGMGFDIDHHGGGNTMQYNYSHDNEGGFLMLCSNTIDECNPGCYDGIVRYNISQNDEFKIFKIGGGVHNAQIYNNTIYVGPSMSVLMFSYGLWNGPWATDIFVYNNIFYIDTGGEGNYDFGVWSCSPSAIPAW